MRTFANPTKAEKQLPFLCGCCYMEALPEERVELECNHPLCFSCYSDYLQSVVKRGPDSLLAACPKEGCKLIVSDTLFRKLLPEIEFKKYLQYYRESYINMSKHTKWCPNPKCKKAVSHPSQNQEDVFCECGKDFCFTCLRPAHRPIDCYTLTQWNERVKGNNDDAEAWIKMNTKACPGCKYPIQKNQGCMHMTCS